MTTRPLAVADVLQHGRESTAGADRCVEVRRIGEGFSWQLAEDVAVPRDPALIDPGLRKVIGGCVRGNSPWPLVMTGEAGSGKTCAGLCIADFFRGWYTTFTHLHANVLMSKNGDLWCRGPAGVRIWERDLWDRWASANICILDEIATRKPTDSQYDTLKIALDKREGKPLVAISNLTMEEISTVCDDRIASRLDWGTRHTLSGDRRVQA